MSDFTPDQEKIVKEILTIETSDYYKLLKVDKGANDIEIKKSYRKLAIKLHPDKNKHPHASEAFKKIAKAFEVLSDADKKRIYDQTGVDPDSRGAGGPGAGGFSGFGGGGRPAGRAGFDGFHPFMQGGGPGGGLFDDDILNMFFGNGAGGGFGGSGFGGNGFTFQFGGPGGPSMFTTGGGPGMRYRRRPQAGGRGAGAGAGRNGNQPQEPESIYDHLKQFIPFLIFIIPLLISSLFGSGNSNSPHNNLPKFSFESQPALPVERLTPNYQVPYYITEKTYNSLNVSPKKMLKLDKDVENVYVNELKNKCFRQRNQRERLIEDSYGWLFVDEQKLNYAKNLKLDACDRLDELKIDLI
ncbi:hypothetical protein BVG19_g4618 [[Candida] boidinii]|nr:hypothetical protein BVG19_g4618 [[Candida] boidinii]OWB48973.1 hypothetical protein B5S27_g512 [[Candida] boidinii]OWB65863.1 hypothetical protein B5S30_g1196 [[Candida] boidinii]